MGPKKTTPAAGRRGARAAQPRDASPAGGGGESPRSRSKPPCDSMDKAPDSMEKAGAEASALAVMDERAPSR
eukprot:4683063-Alexandrium_andersonii.AAC.1